MFNLMGKEINANLGAQTILRLKKKRNVSRAIFFKTRGPDGPEALT